METRISARKRPATRRYEAPVFVVTGRLVPSTRGGGYQWAEPDPTGAMPYLYLGVL